MFEFREIKSETEYKLLELRPDTPFTQAWFFGEWQEKMGRKVRRFEIKRDTEGISFFQAIVYPLICSKKFIYIPHAPVLRGLGEGGEGGDSPSQNFLKEFHKKLVEIGEEENAIFVRFDFYSHNPNYGSKENLDVYFKKVPSRAYHSSYFQPKYEWILDLGKSEKEILDEMHPKTRYNIHLAENKNIRIEIIDNNFEKYFDDFYKILEKTAKRNRFFLHPEIYYQNIFRNCEKNKNAFLAIAKYGNKILAANLILLFGETAYFLYGGLNDEHKNLMAPHLAHWKGILEARRRNYKFYNFGAINGLGWEGISRFKKGFGGKLLKYSDSYDIVLKSFWYKLYDLKKRFL